MQHYFLLKKSDLIGFAMYTLGPHSFCSYPTHTIFSRAQLYSRNFKYIEARNDQQMEVGRGLAY